MRVPRVCGRFTQTFPRDLADLFLGLFGVPQNLQLRYNVAPSREAAAVRGNRNGRCRLLMLR